MKAAIFEAKVPNFHDYLQHLFRYNLKFSNILLNSRKQNLTKIFLLSSNHPEKTPVIIKVFMPTPFAMYHNFSYVKSTHFSVKSMNELLKRYWFLHMADKILSSN